MKTIAECVGGCADGVQLDPCDPSEPDDWPDYIEIEHKPSKSIGRYQLREGKAARRGECRVYYYDAIQ